MSKTAAEEVTELSCEIPTYKMFLLLSAKLSTDWFDETKKKELKKALDKFHSGIDGYKDFTTSNYKTNAAAISKAINAAISDLRDVFEDLAKKKDKSDKDKKFLALVESTLVSGVETYKHKMQVLLKSRFIGVKDIKEKDDRKNDKAETLKELDNPFIDYCTKKNKIDFPEKRMLADAHAVAYAESFTKYAQNLTKQFESLRKKGAALSNDQVQEKVQHIAEGYERFRLHIAKDTKTYTKANGKYIKDLFSAVDALKNAIRNMPIKKD